jgi:hypothetical protein|tara:strand:+ start:1180 stop:1353 length:174 start_codon:yes stop_codon:yes gene_type:complete
MVKENKKDVDFAMFTDKDGYKKGGIDVETTNPAETQEFDVQGQGNILSEKKRKAKLF